DRLHIISHSRNENYDGDVCEADDVDLILPYADSLDEHNIFAGCIKQRGNICSRRSESTKKTTSCHAADINSRIGMVRLHANTVAKNRSARIRTCGINSDDADHFLFLAIRARKLIHERTFAGARRAGKADDSGVSTVLKQRLHQPKTVSGVVFDGTNRPGKGTNIAGADALDERLQRGC